MDTKESIVEFERIAKEWKRATRELSRVINKRWQAHGRRNERSTQAAGRGH